MTVDALQKVFRTLNDPLRLRILALLEREELAVHELVAVLGAPQSTVSRHLAILREAGLVRDRREGTSSYVRLVLPGERAWREAWQLARRSFVDDPIAATDAEALDELLEQRALRSREWFDSVGPEWDRLRRVFHDDVQRARAIGKLVPRGMRVADIGTGTGILALELAHAGVHVIAIDHSQRMLNAARGKLDASGCAAVELRKGEATALPLADGEVDAALAHMVLHYVASPPEAVREMTRVVRAGGRVVIVDFVRDDDQPRDRDWMRKDLGVLWQGFTADAVRGWMTEAGLLDVTVEVHAPTAPGNDLPGTFIASGHRPDQTDS
jgi:ArsR family transcriptional regulator